MADESSLLQQLIRDLSAKVDGLPTRHELDNLNNTVADLKQEFNKFVLVSEFNTYKQYVDQRHSESIRGLEDKMRHLVPRTEHELRWTDEDKKFESFDGLIEDHEDRVSSIEKNQAPLWMRNWFTAGITSVVAAVATALLSHQLYTAFPNSNNLGPATSSTIQTQMNTSSTTNSGPQKH